MNTGKIGSKLSDLILSNATVGILGVLVMVVMLFMAFSSISSAPASQQVLGPLPEMQFDVEVAVYRRRITNYRSAHQSSGGTKKIKNTYTNS